jgi:phage gpG-like protein
MAREAPEVATAAVSEALPSIRVASVSGVKRHFVRQEGPDGRPWPKLKYPRPGGGNKVLRDKGLLAASVQGRVTSHGVELFTSHVGANTHQFGGVITAKRGKFLAIPLTKEAKRIGSPRQNGFPRPLFVLEASGGGLYLVEATSAGQLVFHYALKKSVTIPARPFVGFSEETLQTIERIIATRAERILVRMFDRTVRTDPPEDPTLFT